jgi:hypothetical protein
MWPRGGYSPDVLEEFSELPCSTNTLKLLIQGFLGPTCETMDIRTHAICPLEPG